MIPTERQILLRRTSHVRMDSKCWFRRYKCGKPTWIPMHLSIQVTFHPIAQYMTAARLSRKCPVQFHPKREASDENVPFVRVYKRGIPGKYHSYRYRDFGIHPGNLLEPWAYKQPSKQAEPGNKLRLNEQTQNKRITIARKNDSIKLVANRCHLCATTVRVGVL